MLIKLRKRGQNTAEYAILIGLVIAAAVGMQLYVKRGLQARTKGAMGYYITQTNNIDLTGGAAKTQYEPYYASSDYNVTQTQNAETNIYESLNTQVRSNIDTSRTGSQTYGGLNQE